MKKMQLSIAIGIGDNIMIRGYLDTIKHMYSEIRVSHYMKILQEFRDNDSEYDKFMYDLGKLLFSEPPYIFCKDQYEYRQQPDVLRENNIKAQKPKLAHLLCKGQSLDISEPYIVMTTKVRLLNKKAFYPLSIDLWRTLNTLSKKYKIVIMGEREVEKSKEYVAFNNLMEVHSLYETIISNLPPDRIVDLTVPALGITSPSLDKLQQDCLIMKEAKFVIAIGLGGNYCLSAAVANTILFRIDGDSAVDVMASHQYPDLFMTANWQSFINKLKEYQ